MKRQERCKSDFEPPDHRPLRIFAVNFLLLLALTLFCILRSSEATQHSRNVPQNSTVTVQILTRRRTERTLKKLHRSVPGMTENELIEAALLAQAQVIENCTVTHYDACVACCGKSDGFTITGVQATPYVTVAVDPAVIPLGSDVLVDYGDSEIHYYRADDIGSMVTGNHIDLCVSSHEEAIALGVRAATVYWVEQEEDAE